MHSVVRGLTVAGVFAYVGFPVQAYARDTPPIVVWDNNGGIGTAVTDPGSAGGSATSSTGTEQVSSGAITCSYIPDYSSHGNGLPSWEASDPHTGEKGTWYFRSCSDGSFDPVWIAAAAPMPPEAPSVTPAQLAVQAANYLPLPAPQVHHNPDSVNGRPETVVGVPTWWWVSPASFRTLRQTTAAGGVSATVTATPVSTFWRSGSPDAPDVLCTGSGTPYDPTKPAAAQSTDCSTTYRRSSAGQPQTGASSGDRFFTASVTTTWAVSWVGNDGSSGTLPNVQRTTRFPLAVAELQAVNY